MRALYILLLFISWQIDVSGQKYCNETEWISIIGDQVDFRMYSNGCVVFEYFGSGSIEFVEDEYILIRTKSGERNIDEVAAPQNRPTNARDVKVKGLDDLVSGMELLEKYVVLKYEVLNDSRIDYYLVEITPTEEKLKWGKIRKWCSSKEGCQEIHLRTLYKCNS